jgi:hypothetical protein
VRWCNAGLTRRYQGSCPQTWCNSGAVNRNGHRVILASLD